VVVRFIGVDVHRDFCEVAIVEDGRLRFAEQVAIARIVEPHVGRVVLADPKPRSTVVSLMLVSPAGAWALGRDRWRSDWGGAS
jgi:hypothetical protein